MTSHVNAVAVDTVSYQGSSGANGLLGTVNFFQFVRGSGSMSIPNR
jgi:hypothetical protein